MVAFQRTGRRPDAETDEDTRDELTAIRAETMELVGAARPLVRQLAVIGANMSPAVLARLLRFTHAAMSSKPGAPIDFDDLRFAESLAAPAPTPSEPVERCGFTTDGFRCNDTPLQHRYLCGLLHSHTFVCHPFTSGARDE
jgi:hypothetical protein